MFYCIKKMLQEVQNIVYCKIEQFPIRYLGLPLSTKKLPKAHFQAVVDTVARKLPLRQGPLMQRSGWLI